MARRFIIIGFDGVQGMGMMYSYDISAGSNFSINRESTIGGEAVIDDIYPGLAYDVSTDRIVLWSYDAGSNVYLLDYESGQWTVLQSSGGPNPARNGTHGRWRYSPKFGVFVSVNSVDDNIHVFRSSVTPVNRPNPPQLEGD